MGRFLIVAFAVLAFTAARAEAQNTLTDAEKKAGWILLFDGKSAKAWRGFDMDEFPDGWEIKNGELSMVDEGGHLVTEKEFDNFDLRFDFKISKGGNSGVLFRVSEEEGNAWHTGPEFQILDNPKKVEPKSSCGANFGLHAPAKNVAKPAGQWNSGRIVAKGNSVEHYLNGEKLLEYKINSPAWKKLVEDSQYDTSPEYGQISKGVICLQDHLDKVSFRNLKVLPLKK